MKTVVDMTKCWQNVWHKLKRLVMGLILAIILIACSLFTPIFANLSVLLLNAFSLLTLPDGGPPASLVVLGGGLTKKNGNISLNHYSQSRADETIIRHKKHPLPIITSGVESPWLQDYLKSKLKDMVKTVIISDNASMNTCENAVFTAKLLKYHELPNSVYLVTDRYHMARARRQFARSGILTTPLPAPLSISPSWTDAKSNLVHSRRAIYEIAALSRDILRPQRNCRTQTQISLEEISTPRRQPKIFS